MLSQEYFVSFPFCFWTIDESLISCLTNKFVTFSSSTQNQHRSRERNVNRRNDCNCYIRLSIPMTIKTNNGTSFFRRIAVINSYLLI